MDDASRDGPARPIATSRPLVLVPTVALEDDGTSELSDPLRAEVEAALPQLVFCYEGALRRQPALAGEIEADWTPGGGLGRVDVRGDTLQDAELTACVARRMARWPLSADPGTTLRLRIGFDLVVRSAR